MSVFAATHPSLRLPPARPLRIRFPHGMTAANPVIVRPAPRSPLQIHSFPWFRNLQWRSFRNVLSISVIRFLFLSRRRERHFNRAHHR
jgi:hypothetical protein